MVNINADIVGLKELAANRKALSKSFGRVTLRTALRNATKPVVKRAKELVAVAEGALKMAIASVSKVSRVGEGFARIGYNKEKVAHGGAIELGTSQQPAQPYLRPAIADTEAEILEAFVTALNKTIERRLGRARAGR